MVNSLSDVALRRLHSGVICLSGPTAAGKTALAMALAQELPVELISVDSALIYRQMDIGTAKPTAQELATCPHHLINICDPAEVYSAANFRNDALALIHSIRERGNIPLLVGGTMLYFRALLAGLSQLPAANLEVRAQLQARAEQEGWAALHTALARIDPVAANRIHQNDPQRLLRALEVYEITGKSLTELTSTQEPGLALPSWQIAVAPEQRSLLHHRIAVRFHDMLAHGLVDEVVALRQRGDLHLNLPSMRSVGYRQVWQYLDGDMDYDAMEERAIIATRQLAKRQITWLRSWPGVHWLNPMSVSVKEDAMQVLAQDPLDPMEWIVTKN